MAVLGIFTGVGITKQMYEAMRPEVKWETNFPTGGLLHACGFDDAGDLHVADIWESAEDLDAFVKTRLMPGMQKLGVPPPAVVVFPIHNVNIFPGAKKYFLG